MSVRICGIDRSIRPADMRSRCPRLDRPAIWEPHSYLLDETEQERIAIERQAICGRCADRAELRRETKPQGEAPVRPVKIGRCPRCGYRPCCGEPAIEGVCPRCGGEGGVAETS